MVIVLWVIWFELQLTLYVYIYICIYIYIWFYEEYWVWLEIKRPNIGCGSKFNS